MPTQLHPRIAKRLPCGVRVAGRRHAGVVLNISQGGMFVQTNASTPRGERIDLELSPSDRDGTSIPIQGRVVWKRVVPQQLRTSAHGGLGIQIEQADENYFQLLAAWMRVRGGAAPQAEAAPGPPEAARSSEAPRQDVVADAEAPPELGFRIRVLEAGGLRSRSLEIHAPTVEAAEQRALQATGEGWRIIQVQPIPTAD